VRSIEKGQEPRCVAELRREARRIAKDTGKAAVPTDWEPKDCGDPIREALWREQGGLCAYCMRRIEPRGDKMKIEHFVSRSLEPNRMYDWDNLLGTLTSCAGNCASKMTWGRSVDC
jgi:5-methylcytosine-specific restriction endonuclease McrA